MEAACSSQNFYENGNEVLEIDPSQFLEEMMELILGCQQIEYTPVLTYLTKLEFADLLVIVSTILEHFEIMSTKCERHIHEVIFALIRSPSKVEDYVEFVGKTLLIDRQLEWKYFRAFLALICKLSDLCYRQNIIFLSDNIVLTAAIFIKKDLESRISFLKGWKNFEDDCVEFYGKLKELDGKNRDKEVVGKPQQTQNDSVSSNKPTSSRNCVADHTYVFNNETLGKCFVIESPEERLPKPIVYLGEAVVQSASLAEATMEMTDIVIEVIEISMLALKHIFIAGNEMEA